MDSRKQPLREFMESVQILITRNPWEIRLIYTVVQFMQTINIKGK